MKPSLLIVLAVCSLFVASCKTHDFEPNLGKRTFEKSDQVPHGFRGGPRCPLPCTGY